MRTLDEAIEQERESYQIAKDRYDQLGIEGLKESMEHHEQMLEWLEDYRLMLQMNQVSRKHLTKLEATLHKIEMISNYEKGWNDAVDAFVTEMEKAHDQIMRIRNEHPFFTIHDIRQSSKKMKKLCEEMLETRNEDEDK